MTSPSDLAAKPSPKPARIRFRISIRGILVLVLLVGVWLGWFVHSAKQQREAVEVIERRGGSVVYDYQYRKSELFDSIFDITNECPWPEWMVNAVGIDALCTVVDAHSATGTTLAFRDLTDAELELIGRLRHVKRLSIVSSDVTEAGLRHLGGLGRLEQLLLKVPKAKGSGLVCLDGMGRLDFLRIEGMGLIKDDDLAHIGRRAGLQWLSLDLDKGSSITDAGLAHLSGLGDLRRLELNGLGVTDNGLTALQGMSRLEMLSLQNSPRLAGLGPLRGLTGLISLDLEGSTAINDEAMMVVAGFPRLDSLELSRTSVGDAGLAHLRSLDRLTTLGLGGTKVTDAGMVHVAGLPSLLYLHLVGTSVGDPGAAYLGKNQSLNNLDLRGLSGMTDVGFAALVGLKNLNRIDVTGTRVSTAAVDAARLARPGPRIFH